MPPAGFLQVTRIYDVGRFQEGELMTGSASFLIGAAIWEFLSRAEDNRAPSARSFRYSERLLFVSFVRIFSLKQVAFSTFSEYAL